MSTLNRLASLLAHLLSDHKDQVTRRNSSFAELTRRMNVMPLEEGESEADRQDRIVKQLYEEYESRGDGAVALRNEIETAWSLAFSECVGPLSQEFPEPDPELPFADPEPKSALQITLESYLTTYRLGAIQEASRISTAIARLDREGFADKLCQFLRDKFPDVIARWEEQSARYSNPTAKAMSRGVSNADDETAQTEATPANDNDNPNTAAMTKALSIYASGVANEKFLQIANIIAGNTTVNDKLVAMHKLIPIPPNTPAQLLAVQLGVSKTAITKTSWWKENRAGEMYRKAAVRGDRLRQNELE